MSFSAADHTFMVPVFHEGANGQELIGFTCCMAHWLDVGGSLGQITTDIFSEGIQIPIVKYQNAGRVNQDLVDLASSAGVEPADDFDGAIELGWSVRFPLRRHTRADRPHALGE